MSGFPETDKLCLGGVKFQLVSSGKVRADRQHST